MLGLAVGDALGFPCEFRSRRAILETFGPAGVTDFVGLMDPAWPAVPMIVAKHHPPGTFSDDTQMSIAVARALVDAGSEDLETLMRAMSARFVEWSRSDDNDRAPGSTCMSGCRALGRGAPWREAGVADSKGAGAPMRAVPIGLRYAREPERLREVARASSLPTHGHPTALAASEAVALMVALALEQRPPEEIHARLMDACEGDGDAELRALLARVPDFVGEPPERALVSGALGEAWIAEEAVATALYCFWRTPSDFEATVITAANTDGDSDTIATIAGGVSGAFNSETAIPARFREHVEARDLLVSLADALFEGAFPAT
jgi:ADP-ribosylglycohydrolase